ncbi:beta strand repeat-containing protein [Mucisphaera sp.]|uniref:beta strand repeat-containing protein n=1 Tax=Mucisphaera sp. TaxID=2913024 RepID=UPI003D0AD852
MRLRTATALAASLSISFAGTADGLTFYLSEDLDPVPSGNASITAAVGTTTTLFLWAELNVGELLTDFALELTESGSAGPLATVSTQLWDDPVTINRWSSSSQNVIEFSFAGHAETFGAGLDPADASAFDPLFNRYTDTDSGKSYFRIADWSFTPTSAGTLDLYLTTRGPSLLSEPAFDGTYADIFFGTGDAPLTSTELSTPGTTSALPDASLVIIDPIVVNQTVITATWTGSGGSNVYSEATNWDVGIVPINTASDRYAAVIPASASVALDLTGQTLEVDSLELSGSLSASGSGSYSVLSNSFIGNGVLNASLGAEVQVADVEILTSSNNRNDVILSSDGPGSLLDLSSVELFTHGYQFGARNQTVSATGGGVIDLSGLTLLRFTGGNDDDWLFFQAQGGGQIDLSSLATIEASTNGRALVQFIANNSTQDLPALTTAGDTQLVAGTDGVINAPMLTQMTGDAGVVDLRGGGTLLAPQLAGTQHTDFYVDDGSSLTVSPAGLGSIDNSRFFVEDGAVIDQVTATSYTTDDLNVNDVILSSDGPGSLLDLSSVELFTHGYQFGGRNQTVSATGGGVIDLSGLTLLRFRGGNDDDWLFFQAQGGGQIDLSSLATIEASTNGRALVQFIANNSTQDLPALTTAGDTQLVAGTDGVINAPMLTQMTGDAGIVDLRGGGTLLAPQLAGTQHTDFYVDDGSSLTVSPAGLGSIDNSRFFVEDGAVIDQVTATSYTTDDLNVNDVILSSDGPGSLLDLSSVELFTHGYQFGGRNQTVSATGGGVIDLSGLTLLRFRGGNDDDWLFFQAQGGGQIDLSSLATIEASTNGRALVQFIANNSTQDLPALTTAGDTQLVAGTDGVINAPMLTQMTGDAGIVDLRGGGTLLAPQLAGTQHTDFYVDDGSSLTVSPAGLGSIDNSRFFVEDGAVIDQVTATSYTTDDLNVNDVILSSDGPGSLLDLSSVELFTHGYQFGGRNQTVSATGGGVIDLSGLTLLRFTGGNQDDRLTFRSQGGGAIYLSSLDLIEGSTNGNAKFEFIVEAESSLILGTFRGSRSELRVTDSTANVNVLGDLRLEPTSLIDVNPGTTLSVGGSVEIQATDEARWGLDNARLTLTGENSRLLEVASEDLQLVGSGAGNFGIGQLVVEGSTAGPGPVIQLVDIFDSGNRTQPLEALYLDGLGGSDGLIIEDNATLLLNGLEVYARVAGIMTHLNGLFPAGVNEIAFGGGTLKLVSDSSLLGDIDLDGDIDADDIDLLLLAVSEASDQEIFDLDMDSAVSAADGDLLIEGILNTFYGDANLDGAVDLIDLSLLASNFDGPAGWAGGDFNGSRTVDLIDLSLLASNFGSTASVPEPAAGLIILLGLGLKSRRRHSA